MIEDQEIWACANLLLKQHGADARSTATQRAGELLRAGDLAGYRVFLRILDRIKQLEAMTPTTALH